MTQPTPAAPPPRGGRPTTVTAASALFVVAAALMLLQAAFTGTYRDWMQRMVDRQLELMNIPEYARVDAASNVTMSLVQTAVSLVLAAAFWVLLAMLLYRGRNWARIVLIVFGVLATVVGPLSMLFVFAIGAPPPPSYVLTALPGWLAVVAGFVLVLRPSTKAWCTPPPPVGVSPWQGNPAGPAG